jgi:hypothetical protein
MRIEYDLSDIDIDSKTLKTGGSLLFPLIEGSFSIYFDTYLFFFEPYFNLLEFSASLYKWLYSDKMKSDYFFRSIDSDQIILTFSRMRDSSWLIDSIWKKGDTIRISKKDLEIASIGFIQSLDMVLEQKYNLKSMQFVKYLI